MIDSMWGSTMRYNMQSNMRFKISLTIILVMSFLGCSLKTNEKPPKLTKATPKVQGLGCLDKTMKYAESFFKAETTNEELTEFWQCTSNVLAALKKNVRGETEGRYSSKELVQFLQTYYIKDHKVSDELLHQVMMIKQIFIGGDSNYLTVAEIDKTIGDYIPQVEKITLELNPFMSVYTLKWKVTNSDQFDSDADYFEAAHFQLQKSANELAAIIEKHNVQYDLHNIQIFFTELETLLDRQWDFVEELNKYLPLIANVKSAVSGGQNYLVTADEWPSFLILSARGYAQILRFKYFVREINVDSITQSQIYYLMRTIDDTFSMFSDLLVLKKDPFIRTEELYNVLQSFSGLYPDFKVSRLLVEQFFKLKKALIGGTDTSFNSSDFKRGRTKISSVEKILDLLLPSLNILSLDKDLSKLSDADKEVVINDVSNKLNQAVSLLHPLFESDYDVANLEVLLNEITNLYPTDILDENSSKITQLGRIIKDIKPMIWPVGNTTIVKSLGQWQEALTSGGEYYKSVIHHFYFFNGLKADQFLKLDRYKKWIKNLIQKSADLINYSPVHGLTVSQLLVLSKDIKDFSADWKITDEFIIELLKLKPAFLNGNTNTIQSQELVVLVGKLDDLFQIYDGWKSYELLYQKKWNPGSISETDKKIEWQKAENNLFSLTQILTPLLIGPYDLKNFEGLLRSAQTSLEVDLAEMIKFSPLILELKAQFWTTGESIVSSSQWSQFVNSLIKMYSNSLNQYYFFDQVKFAEGLKNNEYFKLMQSYLSVIQQMFKAEPAGTQLTHKEIDSLLAKLKIVFPELKYDMNLIQEFMGLKEALTGEPAAHLNVYDSDYLVAHLPALREIFIFVNENKTWMKMDGMPPLIVSAIMAKLNTIKQGLADLIVKYSPLLRGSYDLNRLISLIKSLNQLEYTNMTPEEFAKLESDMPLIIKAKTISKPEGASVIMQPQWTSLLGISNQALYTMMWRYYLLPKELVFESLTQKTFIDFAGHLLNTLEVFLTSTPNKRVDTRDLNDLADIYVTTQKPKDVTAKNLKGLIPPLVQKLLLTAQSRFAHYKAFGFEMLHLNFVKDEFRRFVVTNDFSNQVFTQLGQVKYEQAALLPLLDNKIKAEITAADIKKDLLILRSAMGGTFTQQMNSEGLLLLNRVDQTKFNSITMKSYNLYRALIQIVFNGYSTSLAQAQNMTPMKEEQLQAFYNDVSPFFFDIKLLDPKNIFFVSSRFLEANLFTPLADGGKEAGIEELMGVAAQIYSGSIINSKSREFVFNNCKHGGDDPHTRYVEEECLRHYYLQTIAKYFTSMPEFVDAALHFDVPTYHKLITGLEQSAGFYGNEVNIFETDYSLMPHVSQYIETMMIRYDIDKDMHINKDEAKKSLPLLGPLLEEISGMSGEKDQLAVLTYFLKYGKAPSTWDFIKWRLKGESGWKVSAGREQLAAVLGYIAEEGEKKKILEQGL